jgi:hypothetical protein
MTLNCSLSSVATGTTISSTTENTNILNIENASPYDLIVYDSTISGHFDAHFYTGTTDPSTIGGITVVNGDIWIDGRYANPFDALFGSPWRTSHYFGADLTGIW